MSRFDDATLRQIRAGDPDRSTWVAANAGSGKTRVLTDRVARLLLRGVPPQNILCLTYTKAAASEMQNRLFKRLGEWAMMPDAELLAKLADLEEEPPDRAASLAEARRLFARAIDAPGGLKTQTIHSFCAGLLRRFPVEAGIPPGFSEIDDEAGAELVAGIVGRLAEDHPDAFAGLARLPGGGDPMSLALEITGLQDELPGDASEAAVFRALGLPEGTTRDAALTAPFDAIPPGGAEGLAERLAAQTATSKKVADALVDLENNGPSPERISALTKALLVRDGDRMNKNVLSEKRRPNIEPWLETFDQLVEDCIASGDTLRCLDAAEKTLTLHAFAALFLPEWRAAKLSRGWLDFDDLTRGAERLLTREGVADWVLYRLDGSLDHVLVDEAQDTSPEQWRVIDRLTAEFAAGLGAGEDRPRTVFAVGDPKQSIYSFQGADPSGFERMRARFSERLTAAGRAFQRSELTHSFRSAPAILRTVDTVFRSDRREGMGDYTDHIAFNSEMPGRVDLWPNVEPEESAADEDWTDPVDLPGSHSAPVILARRIASEVQRMIREEVLWGPAREGHPPRRIGPGDILILVQGRGPLFHEIISACKEAELEVAGADVLRLTEDLAVRDLLALLSFVSLPEDDLSLAAILRSPLFGWSEDDLFRLAHGRRVPLWAVLRERQEVHPETHAILRDLLDQADYLRPFELLTRILVRHDGRRRLVARLGRETEDAIEALLTRALRFEEEGIPGLTAFLASVEGTDLKVKRRPEARGGKLRVMTVHGAKGLEAPVVFLPDTSLRPERMRGRLVATPDGLPVWASSKAEASSSIAEFREAALEKERQERRRLLYVAMTRAEQWLIVGHAGKEPKDASWYAEVAEGLEAAGAVSIEMPGGEGLRLEEFWRDEVLPPAPETVAQTPPDARDPGRPFPPPAPRAVLTPSDMGGAKVLFLPVAEPGPEGALPLPEEEALQRGRRIHLLLEHLPAYPRGEWPRLAPAILRSAGEETEEWDALLDEAARVLSDELLAPLFSSEALAEVEITADLPGRPERLRGVIDRLIVTPEVVTAVDFKTNAIVPARAEDVPDGLLRQMGAYSAALQTLYPGRRIDTAILWTRTPELMPLPAGLTRDALARTPLA
ncbi:double-strand break repair helicase AddA [Tropicimonas sp. IMCC34011]|uniref:double-strand break repair helicase AddA n=1 Tax=Tropicimonas sp. IMCC34011 TaxID=2248759 RepID=UPI000E28633C|nr:double-strand break repair helicase AddA [Tropicimonas sp. IMCC34011]